MFQPQTKNFLLHEINKIYEYAILISPMLKRSKKKIIYNSSNYRAINKIINIKTDTIPES
jgi:hypothetical protein